MRDIIYLRAGLDGVRFAVPSMSIERILSDPVVLAVPLAPEGICGIVCFEGAVTPVRSLVPGRQTPASLVILCRGSQGLTAYAADRVEAMGMLDEREFAGAEAAEAGGVLLLDRRKQDD